VGLGDGLQPMSRKNSPDTRRISLGHVVNPDCERDGHILLEGNGCEQGMLRAARAAALGQHKSEVGAVGVASVRELVEMPRGTTV